MQKFHVILAWTILLLLILHLAMGVVTLLTPVFLLQSGFAYVFFGLVCVHGILALWKVVKGKRPGEVAAYLKENQNYWLRVGSGVAIFVLALIHRTLWTIHTPFGVLLRDFEWPSLLAQLLLVAALAVHVTLNIRPLLLDSGIDTAGKAKKLMRLLTALLLLVAAVGAVCYFAGVSL